MSLDRNASRRRFLVGVASGAAVLPLLYLSRAQAGDLPHLESSDSTAQALGYVEDHAKIDSAKEAAYVKGSHCGGCALYQGEAKSEWGPCAVFPGKDVKASGWCRSFAPLS